MTSCRHPGFQRELVALTEASAVVGGRQVRNIATVGGNIVNASPAADLVPVLLALDATVDLQGAPGHAHPAARPLPPGSRPHRAARRRAADGGALRPAARGERDSAFLKAGRRKAMEISVVCVAAHLEAGAGGRGIARRGSRSAPRPRAPSAPRAPRPLVADGGAAAFAEAGRLAAAAAAPIDDVRASARYRRLLVATLVERALARCRGPTAERDAMTRAPLELTINGETHQRDGRAALDPAAGAARRARPHRHQGELPRGRVRRLHRPARRQGGQFLHPAGRSSARGRSIVTIEGLGDPEHLHPLQAAFIECGAVQCGYCIPGMILTAKSFLDECRGRVPSEPEIREALSGTLCRCTGYQKIVDAVAARGAADGRQAHEQSV